MEVAIVGQQSNAEVEIKEYDDLITLPTTVHAFCIKHLLPIWFNVQCIDYDKGTNSAKQWRYS